VASGWTKKTGQRFSHGKKTLVSNTDTTRNRSHHGTTQATVYRAPRPAEFYEEPLGIQIPHRNRWSRRWWPQGAPTSQKPLRGLERSRNPSYGHLKTKREETSVCRYKRAGDGFVFLEIQQRLGRGGESKPFVYPRLFFILHNVSDNSAPPTNNGCHLTADGSKGCRDGCPMDRRAGQAGGAARDT